MPTLKRRDLTALCEAIGTSEFIAKRYLHVAWGALQYLSENGTKPVTAAVLMAKLQHDAARVGHLLTALEKAGLVKYRYGAGLPEDGAWEVIASVRP